MNMMKFLRAALVAVLAFAPLAVEAGPFANRHIRVANDVSAPILPILDLDFAPGTGVLDPLVTVVRASEATFLDSGSVLQVAASGVARVDSYIGGVNHGLQREKEAEKLALWSRNQTNGVWVSPNITAVQNATGIDLVANSATTLTATAGNATSLQTLTLGSAEYTVGVYVKRVSGTGDIQITDDNGANWTTLTGLSSSLWMRYSLTRTQANPVIGIHIVDDGDVIEVDFFELETGKFSTSVLETTSGTVTRAEDIVTVTSFPAGFTEAGVTYLAEFSTAFSASGNPNNWVVSVSNGSSGTAHDLGFEVGTANVPRMFVHQAGLARGNLTTLLTIGSNQLNTVVWSVAINNLSASSNGLPVRTDSTVSPLPTGLNVIKLGRRGNDSASFSGHIKRFKIWPADLDNGYLVSRATQ